jgi:hypothetical protein
MPVDPLDQATRPSNPPPPASGCAQRCKNLGKFAYDLTTKVAGYILLGGLFLLFFPSAAYSCFVVAGIMTVTHLAVKTVEWYNVALLDSVKRAALKVRDKIPLFRLIAFIFILAMSALSVIAGMTFAGLFGGYNGLVFDAAAPLTLL